MGIEPTQRQITKRLLQVMAMGTANNQAVIPALIIGWILLSANPSRIAALTPSLTSTLLEGNIACPGRTVVFTCRTSGSLEWSSDEYIGTGGRRLTVGAANINETIHSMISTAYAVLVNADQELTSKLYIVASLSSSVTCKAILYYGQNSSIKFDVLDVPRVPKDVIALQIRYLNGLCFINAFWKSPGNNHQARVTHYIVDVNGMVGANETANINTTTFSSSFAITCGASHTVDISAGNVCGIEGQSASYLIRDQNQQCPINIDIMIPGTCFATEVPTNMTLAPSTPAITTSAPTTSPVTTQSKPIINPTITQPTNHEQNSGNAVVVLVSCSVVAAMVLLDSS